MEYKLELHEFFVEGGNREKSHVLIHITEPSTPEEKAKGYFFVIAEQNQATSKDVVYLQDIVDEIEAKYYEAPESINENPLETVLKIINRKNVSFSENLKMSCLVGVVRQEQIVFSFCGEPKMMLIYPSKDGNYKKINLINKNEENEHQLFSQLVEGKVTPKDFIFIATPGLSQFFDDDRLMKIVSTRMSRQSAEHIERVLSDIKNETSFGGMIINLKEELLPISSAKKRAIAKGGSVKSLNNLLATERHTSATLSPSLFPKINRQQNNIENQPAIGQRFSETPDAEIKSSHLRQYQARPAKVENQDIFREYLLLFAKKIWMGIVFIGQIIWYLIIIIFKAIVAIGNYSALLFLVITNYQNRRRNITDNWIKDYNELKKHIKNLPKATKIFTLASFSTLVIFVFGLFYIHINKINTEKEKQSADIIRQIIDHKNQAENAMIFKEDEKVISQTIEAKQLLSQLDCKKYDEQCTELSKQLDNLLSQVRKEVAANSDLLFDMSQNNFNLKYLAKINNKILALSQNTSTVAIFDLLTKQHKTVHLEVSSLNDITIPKENDYVLILANNKDLITYNTSDDSFKTIDVSYNKNNVQISNILIYNRRLYSLDTFNNQIYKHDSIKNGFDMGKDWLKDLSINIKDSESMTIDGDLFISNKNGEITKINAGNKQAFNISGLDPALKNGGEIWTYTDKKFIYLLDSEQKRLIVMDKDGRVNRQITSKDWNNPTGMAIDEQNKRAFILDSDRLLQINL